MHGMEEMPQKTIAIQCSDGKMVEVPNGVETKLSRFHEYFDVSQQSDEANVVVELMESDDGAEYTDLGSNILSALFACVDSKKKIKNLENKSLISVFDAGEVLGASKKFMRLLSCYIQELVLFDEQPELVQNDYYVRSIRYLHGKNCLKIELDQSEHRLKIEKQKIDSLIGIDAIAKQHLNNKNIISLSLVANRIKVLNVMQLLELLPNLQVLIASNNRIERLIMPNRLPDNFRLDLICNPIQELPRFKIGEKGIVDLRRGWKYIYRKFSEQSLQVCQYAVQPTLLERYRPYTQPCKRMLAEPLFLATFPAHAEAVLVLRYLDKGFIDDAFFQKLFLFESVVGTFLTLGAGCIFDRSEEDIFQPGQILTDDQEGIPE